MFISFIDHVKHQLLLIFDGKIFVKLVTMATLSTNTEVQYNSAGILGQLALTGKFYNFIAITMMDIVTQFIFVNTSLCTLCRFDIQSKLS